LYVYGEYRSPSYVEDAQLLAQLNNDQVTEVEIPGLGRVQFPKDMPEKEIEALIRDNFDKNKTKIPELAKAQIRERNESLAIEARKEDDVIRNANRKVLLLGYGGWLAFVVFLYVAGWSIGWVRCAFKAT
jgi:hypothetical protein